MTITKCFNVCDLEEFISQTGESTEWQPVYPPMTLSPKDPQAIFGSIDFAFACERLTNKTFSIPEVGCLHVRDAYVAGYGLVTSQDNALLDRNFTISRDELGLYGYFTDVEHSSSRIIKFDYADIDPVPEAIMLLHRGDTVHGHWLLEVLPRVLLGLRAKLTDPYYIVSSEIRPYQIEMLEAVGVSRARLLMLKRNQRLQCKHLVVPSIAHTNSLWIHPYCNETFNFLVGLVNGEKKNLVLSKKIFVTRKSRTGDTRPLINCSAIERILTEYGYSVIDPGEILWKEQIAYFSHAESIIGLSGSGLHNTVFSGESAKVITLQPNQNWNYLQASIATIRHHENSFFFGESMAAFDDASWETPFIIDEDLMRLVAK